jgi:hypothetical protein
MLMPEITILNDGETFTAAPGSTVVIYEQPITNEADNALDSGDPRPLVEEVQDGLSKGRIFNVMDLLALHTALEDGVNEKGNVYLTNEDGGCHLAFLSTGNTNQWLQVQIIPENYPSLNVKLIEASDEMLAKQINEQNAGWFVKKANLPGIKMDKYSYVE